MAVDRAVPRLHAYPFRFPLDDVVQVYAVRALGGSGVVLPIDSVGRLVASSATAANRPVNFSFGPMNGAVIQEDHVNVRTS